MALASPSGDDPFWSPSAPPVAILLIGPPGCGKTTWRAANEWAFPRLRHRELVVLSTDDLIEAWGKVLGVSYSEAFDAVDFPTIEAAMMATFHAALARNADILVDRTNLTAKSRARFLDAVPLHYQRQAVRFEVSETELRRRLDKRAAETGKRIPDAVVAQMLTAHKTSAPSDAEVADITTIRWSQY